MAAWTIVNVFLATHSNDSKFSTLQTEEILGMRRVQTRPEPQLSDDSAGLFAPLHATTRTWQRVRVRLLIRLNWTLKNHPSPTLKEN